MSQSGLDLNQSVHQQVKIKIIEKVELDREISSIYCSIYHVLCQIHHIGICDCIKQRFISVMFATEMFP